MGDRPRLPAAEGAGSGATAALGAGRRRSVCGPNLAVGPAGAGFAAADPSSRPAGARFRCRTWLSARFSPRNDKKHAENDKARPKRRHHALVNGGKLRRRTAIRPVEAPDAVPSAFDCFYLSGRGVAQLVAHLLWEQEAGGSSPPSPTPANHRSPRTTADRGAGAEGLSVDVFC